jgi:Ni/Fe-hydrogenase subunit HybB-like protein
MIFVVVRIADMGVRGVLPEMFSEGFLSFMFFVEMILFVIPIVLLLPKGNRKNAKILFYSAVAAVLAGALYRFNAFLVAFNPGAGWHYFPSVSEMLITIGLISFEIMAYLFLVKKLPILASAHKPK